jgi:hypothetical protein
MAGKGRGLGRKCLLSDIAILKIYCSPLLDLFHETEVPDYDVVPIVGSEWRSECARSFDIPLTAIVWAAGIFLS